MTWRNRRRTGGFSLSEVLAAMFVISIGLPAVAYMYTAALKVDADGAAAEQAYFLANSLMNEISQRRFRETTGLLTNGPDTGEVSGYDRRNFDDIDDYKYFAGHWGHLTPPRDEQGNTLTAFNGFSQYVDVINVPAPGSGPSTRTLSSVTDGSTDYKLVTVVIQWENGKRAHVMQKLFAAP